jgi:translocator protein
MASDVVSGPSSARSRWLGLVGFAAAAAAAALVGALGTSSAATEYTDLERPSWAPPSWVFGPVWTVLYATIAIAGWLVWQRGGWNSALTVYAIQLVLNAAWTPIFFGAGRYGLALLDIVILWALIGVTIALFWRISRPAAVILVPYWAWVTYATALNTAIWTAN